MDSGTDKVGAVAVHAVDMTAVFHARAQRAPTATSATHSVHRAPTRRRHPQRTEPTQRWRRRASVTLFGGLAAEPPSLAGGAADPDPAAGFTPALDRSGGLTTGTPGAAAGAAPIAAVVIAATWPPADRGCATPRSTTAPAPARPTLRRAPCPASGRISDDLRRA